MMIQLPNANVTYPCRQCSAGHGTILPNPVPGQPRQLKSMIKAGDITPDSRNLRASHTKLMSSEQSHDPPPIAKPSKPHRP